MFSYNGENCRSFTSIQNGQWQQTQQSWQKRKRKGNRSHPTFQIENTNLLPDHRVFMNSRIEVQRDRTFSTGHMCYQAWYRFYVFSCLWVWFEPLCMPYNLVNMRQCMPDKCCLEPSLNSRIIYSWSLAIILAQMWKYCKMRTKARMKHQTIWMRILVYVGLYLNILLEFRRTYCRKLMAQK